MDPLNLLEVKEEFGEMSEEYLEEDEDDEYSPVIKKTRAQPKKIIKLPTAPKLKKAIPNSSKVIKVTNPPIRISLVQPTKQSSPPLLTPIKTNKPPNANNLAIATDLPKILLDDPENAYGLHIAQQMRQFASFEREILRNKINNMVFTAFIEYQKRKKE